MFLSRRGPFFWSRRRTRYSIGAAAGLAAVGAVAAATAVYFLDPESGRRRRALLRDQAVRAGQRGRELAGKFGRSVSNLSWPQLIGIGGDVSDGVLVQKTIHVYADVDEAYACWRKLEEFPRFMSHVREVTKIDDTHYHWKVDGPAGVPVEWDAVITADVPGELIAWRTMEDSAVQSVGVVQFEPSNRGGARYGSARVHVRLSYRPPVNRVGHTVAKVFGKDPQRQIDSDLSRFKTFIETGRRPRDNAAASQARH